MHGLVRSVFGDPDLRSPSGFDFGLRPPLRMTRRAGSGALELVRSAIGDPDLRSPSGFDSGLRPPLRMTRRGGKWWAEVLCMTLFSVRKCLIGMSNCLKKRIYTY